eukprot:scpid13576/ scgid4002/ 
MSNWCVPGALHVAVVLAIVSSTRYHPDGGWNGFANALGGTSSEPVPPTPSVYTFESLTPTASGRVKDSGTLFVSSKSVESGFSSPGEIFCGYSLNESCPSLMDALWTAHHIDQSNRPYQLTILLVPTALHGCKISAGSRQFEHTFRLWFKMLTIASRTSSDCPSGAILVLVDESHMSSPGPVYLPFSSGRLDLGLSSFKLVEVNFKAISFSTENFGCSSHSNYIPLITLDFNGLVTLYRLSILFQNCSFQVSTGCFPMQLWIRSAEVKVLYDNCKFFSTEQHIALLGSVILIESFVEDSWSYRLYRNISFHMQHCEFFNIRSQITNGSFISFKSNLPISDISIHLRNCTFRDNALSQIIHWQDACPSRLSLKITSTSFERNTVERLFHAASNSIDMLVTNTDFQGMTILQGSSPHGLMSIEADRGNVRISNCSFSGSTSQEEELALPTCPTLASYIVLTGAASNITVFIENSVFQVIDNRLPLSSMLLIAADKAPTPIILSGSNAIRGQHIKTRGPLFPVGSVVLINGGLETNFDSSFLQRLEGQGARVVFRKLSNYHFMRAAERDKGYEKMIVNTSMGLAVHNLYQFSGSCGIDRSHYDPSQRQAELVHKNRCYQRVDAALVFVAAAPGEDGADAGWRDGPLCRGFGLATDAWENSSGDEVHNVNWTSEPYSLCSLPAETDLLAVAKTDHKLRDFILMSSAWLLFSSSSAECYKQINNTWFYLRPSCTVAEFHASMTLKRLLLKSQRHSSAARLADKIKANPKEISNVVIAGPLLLSPWAHYSGITWNDEAMNNTDPTYVSDLTLYPAPGEHLAIDIGTYDDLLTPTKSRLKVQVFSEDKDKDSATLLRYGSKGSNLYEILHELYFISGTSLLGIAIGGSEGATGSLRFTMVDKPNKKKWTDGPFHLSVPFKLRPCHKGFTGPVTKGAGIVVCECSSENPAIKRCPKGRFVIYNRGYWAGNTTSMKRAPQVRDELFHKVHPGVIQAVTDPSTDNASTFSSSWAFRAFVDYQYSEVQCTNGLCQQHGTWVFGNSSACIHNGAGILCGQCAPGTKLKLATARCTDCSQAKAVIPLGVYISVIIVMTILSACLMFYFNVGLSPVLDSWLFFVQTSWYIFPKDNKFVYSSVYTVLTFGLGHLCMTKGLNRLQVSTLLLIKPITLLLIFLAIRIARSYNYLGTRLARLQSHMKLVRVMWFVLVYSYFMLTFTALSVFWCVQINDRQVLAMDGSVDCYVSPHLGYVLAAVAILAIVILPPPLLLLIRRTHGHIMLKGFVDEACCMYTDECRWWSAVNLLRRIAIGLLGSLPFSSAVSRLLVTSGFLLLLLMVHSTVRPLRKGDFAGVGYNTWESFMLCISICISVLYSVMYASQMTENYVLWVSGALFLTPTALVLTALLYRQCLAKEGGYGRFRILSVRRIWQHWQRGRGRERNESHLDETALANLIGDIRDPLLVDNIRDQQEGRL